MRINAFMLQSIVLVEILIFFKNYNGNYFCNSGQFYDIKAPLYAKATLYVALIAFFVILLKIIASDLYSLW